MQAMVYHHYGSPDRLELREVDRPSVAEDEVLVRVVATSLNWLDYHFLTGAPLLARLMAGLFRPKHRVLGIDMAGRVEAAGSSVAGFAPGDEVFGSCSHGCFAGYVAVSSRSVVEKPANLSFEEAAAVPAAASTALQALRDHGRIRPGKHVLINGASGGVGTFAVQIAKAYGAIVTGVCSARNTDLVRSLGADHVIDYTEQDFALNEGQYDVVFDSVARRSFADCRRALSPNGVYITTAFGPLLALYGLWSSSVGSKRMVPKAPKPPDREDLLSLCALLKSGQVKPVIDRVLPLRELPGALHYLATGHARGKVVLTVEPASA